MKKMSGGQAAVASLQAEKVEHEFGLIGSATMEMFDAAGFRVERIGEVGEAVQAALYSFRPDSFKH